MCRRWLRQRKALKGKQIDAFALTARSVRKGLCDKVCAKRAVRKGLCEKGRADNQIKTP